MPVVAARGPFAARFTNLLLRVGDYAHQGATSVSIIDSDSYWSMAILKRPRWHGYASESVLK
jgi:multidrug resistance efflux pump